MIVRGKQAGHIVRIAGPVVEARGLCDVRLFDVVRVGELGLVGEVIRLSDPSARATTTRGDGATTTIQVYEDTAGVRIGDPVRETGMPLVATLGPGLLGSVYDGLQRPLPRLAARSGAFIQRGVEAAPLPAEALWPFTPVVKVGARVRPGDVLGTVPESRSIEHRILVPPHRGGRVAAIEQGTFRVDDVIAVIEPAVNGSARHEITLAQRWPVRQPRPARTHLDPREPLITGMRIIDALFPVAKGGSAIIPGGFGTGKTVAEHSLARWADTDVVVYVGCGERGNEMPGEEGYPAYLAARLAEFYERSGRVVCLGSQAAVGEGHRAGSVTVVGAVSPPGGDFSEPMTQNSMRVAGTFWGLDYDLSRRRHFPAINWTSSYSLYYFTEWYTSQVAEDWADLTGAMMALLQRERELLEIIDLVGPDALAVTERAELAVARMVREDFLQQSAYHEVDRYCPLEKTYWMLKTTMAFHRNTMAAVAQGINLETITGLRVVEEIARMKQIPADQAVAQIREVLARVHTAFSEMGVI